MHPLFLIGFMGSGKSTVGKALSEREKLSFVDTDVYIEEKYKMEISEIFARFGEEIFRKYENKALKEVLLKNIIATGGGIVEQKDNISLMNENGVIVYLYASFAEIDRRLQGDRSRPLWVNSELATKQALYEQRDALYRRHAHYIIDTDNRTINEIIMEILHKIPLNETS